MKFKKLNIENMEGAIKKDQLLVIQRREDKRKTLVKCIEITKKMRLF